MQLCLSLSRVSLFFLLFFLLSNSPVLTLSLSLSSLHLPPFPPPLALPSLFLFCLLVERFLLAFCRRRSLVGADIRIDKTKVSLRVSALF